MSALEIAELCDALPPEKREEVADFARFLIARQQDEQWETLIANPKPRPRLDAFLSESAAEADEALDLNRL
jgi:predicted outer membrane protein